MNPVPAISPVSAVTLGSFIGCLSYYSTFFLEKGLVNGSQQG